MLITCVVLLIVTGYIIARSRFKIDIRSEKNIIEEDESLNATIEITSSVEVGTTNTHETTELDNKTQTQTLDPSKAQFPDRSKDISWHITAIKQSLNEGDLELANLSYAKRIESIRQQNINDNGIHSDLLTKTQEEYANFRQKFGMEYPPQFLPKQSKIKENKTAIPDNTLLYLEAWNYSEIPKSIIDHIDVVRTISQWNELKFNPKRVDGWRWNDIKRQGIYFRFADATLSNIRHKTSLETGKKITSNPYSIKSLVEQGLSIERFVDNGDDLRSFIAAENLASEKKYAAALTAITEAINVRPLKEYTELRKVIQIKLGNTDVARQYFKDFEYDIDSPIHTSEIYDWFKTFTANEKFEEVVHFIIKTNETLEELSKGKIKPRIYGQQSGDWYIYKRSEFNKNLHRIFDFGLSGLDKNEVNIKMLGLFVTEYSGNKTKAMESIADLYSKWGMSEKATNAYQRCLNNVDEKSNAKSYLRIKTKMLSLKNFETNGLIN